MMGHCTGAGNEAQDCRCDGGILKTAVLEVTKLVLGGGSDSKIEMNQ